MTTTYRDAATKLWGPAGDYVHDSYSRMRDLYFPELPAELPAELPIVIGITAYGSCIGLTRPGWEHGPRITIASKLFSDGGRRVDDVMLHEMLHVRLALRGRSPDHADEPWYDGVRRLSPLVLGQDLDVRRGGDRRSVRLPNPDRREGQPPTVPRKVRVQDAVPHQQVATWPIPFRPADYYAGGTPILCPSY